VSWLAQLKLEKATQLDASKPGKPPEGEQKEGFPGFLAGPSNLLEKIEAHEGAANDSPSMEPMSSERWCWPHSDAMNYKEIDIFTARVILFTEKGLEPQGAESLADKLVIRDRDYDDRRLCLECAHLQGHGRWSCRKWAAAGVARDALAPDLVLGLHRCGGFTMHREAHVQVA
jgi:hypothetical protein